MGKRKGSMAVLWLVAFVLLTAVFAVTPRSEAAVFTSNYSYIINGKEVAVGIDPLSLKSGLLLPSALLDQVGGRFVDKGDSMVLNRSAATVSLRLGSTNAVRGPETIILPSAPLRLGGQVYVPSEALKLLGLHITTESNMLLIESWPAAKGIVADANEYDRSMQIATQEHWMEPSRDDSVKASVTRLTKDLIQAAPWTSDTFVRGRALELLDTNLLLQVTIKNHSDTVFTFPVTSYYLVDDLGNQYQLSGQVIPVSGDLFGPLAPGTRAAGVLVYSPVKPDARSLNLYLQTGSATETLASYFFNH